MVKEEIEKIIQDVAASLGYIVYEYSIYLKGENTKIVVKIDSLDVISHQDCEMFSNEFAGQLDESEILPNYTLEISSPGINRKLRNRDEFNRFRGAPVKVKYKDKDRISVIKGTLSMVNENGIILSIEDKDVSIFFNDIIGSNLDY